MIENLPHQQEKAKKRIEAVKKAVDILGLFFEIGYRTKQNVFTQLIIHFPKHNTDSSKNTFKKLWHCISYDLDMIKDLEIVINKINAK